MLMVNDGRREAFTDNCSVHAMGYAENQIFEDYYKERAEHPDQDDIDFVIEHFPPPPEMDAEEYSNIIDDILNHISYHEGVNGLIMQMYIADAIIRHDARNEDK